MSRREHAAERGPAAAFLLCAALFGATLAFEWLNPPAEHSSGSWGSGGRVTSIGFAVAIAAFPVVGWLILRRDARNVIGWLMMAIGVVWCWTGFTDGYTLYAYRTSPGSLPGAALIAWTSQWTWVPAIALMGVYVLLLFPDGHLPSRHWRWLPWVSGVLLALGCMGLMFTPGVMKDASVAGLRNPIGLEVFKAVPDALTTGLVWLPIGIVCSTVALLIRFHRSSGQQRLQLKWLTTAGALVAPLYFATMAITLSISGQPPHFVIILQNLCLVSFVIVPLAIGIAILRHRLYDIDVVISRSLVFGALATFITAVYVAVVVGIGHLIGRGDQPNLALSVVATAVVAVAFEPVRDRLQNVANRLVYGQRATPYEVLSDFADRMGGAYDATQLLPLMARTVGQGVEAARASVWLRSTAGFELSATWTEDNQVVSGGRQVSSLDDVAGDRVVQVSDRGEVLGAIAVVKPAGKELTPVEDGLLETLATQAGPVLRNVRLIEDLRSSRQRLVARQDEERRRLERNLHDGAQQSLVAVALMLRLVQSKVAAQDERAGASLDNAADELAQAIEDLRSLARGIYPVVLTERGLGAALSSLAERLPVPVVVDDQLDGRVEADVERAVYFIAFEALSSASRAEAHEADVRLERTERALVLQVSDDGSAADDQGRGLAVQNLLDRAAVVNAALTFGKSRAPGLHLECRVTLPEQRSGESEDAQLAAVPMGAGQ